MSATDCVFACAEFNEQYSAFLRNEIIELVLLRAEEEREREASCKIVALRGLNCNLECLDACTDRQSWKLLKACAAAPRFAVIMTTTS